ncbi:MAG: hypothetical protein H6833_14190 [Planctomycetes bacterium]|nr:hypothetical protein [Planctomycetota bacterium]
MLTRAETLAPLRAKLAEIRALSTKTRADRALRTKIKRVIDDKSEDAKNETSIKETLEDLWSSMRDTEALTVEWDEATVNEWVSDVREMLGYIQSGDVLLDSTAGKTPSVTKLKNMLRRVARGETQATRTCVEQAHDWLATPMFSAFVDGDPRETEYSTWIAAISASTTEQEWEQIVARAKWIEDRRELRRSMQGQQP